MTPTVLYFYPGRKSSPTHSRLSTELSVEKDEGISDDDDPTELRLLLELSEQVHQKHIFYPSIIGTEFITD